VFGGKKAGYCNELQALRWTFSALRWTFSAAAVDVFGGAVDVSGQLSTAPQAVFRTIRNVEGVFVCSGRFRPIPACPRKVDRRRISLSKFNDLPSLRWTFSANQKGEVFNTNSPSGFTRFCGGRNRRIRGAGSAQCRDKSGRFLLARPLHNGQPALCLTANHQNSR
jgi:hypothetical protein